MADADNQKPLAGLVLCGTSLKQDIRGYVTSLARELGAVYKLDLTSDVTHLLCGSISSEKYRHVAKHRPDVCVLQPQWIFAIRDAWMEGGDVDVESLAQHHRLPVFESLRICVSGFTNVKHRQWLQDVIPANGATYHGDLTKTVSHLVVCKPEGPKYDHAKTWGIKIVSLSWLEQSLERGMILDEACFDPLAPLDQQGKDSFEPRVRRHEVAKRVRPGDDDSQNLSKRKMRRTASTRLNSQSQSLWADLSLNEDSEVPQLDDSWTQSVDPGIPPQPTVNTQPAGESFPDAKPSLSTSTSSVSAGRGLFSDWSCMPYGFDETPKIREKLEQYLEENGAAIAEDHDALRSAEARWKAMVVPSKWTANPPADLPAPDPEIHILTEWWVERCILRRKAIEPDKDILSTSLHHLPRDLFKDMAISTSGLGDDIRHVAHIVKAGGGEYESDLSRKTTLLIHDPAKTDVEKPVYCAERNINVVTPQWFWDCLKKRALQQAGRYRLPDEVCVAIQRIRDKRRKNRDGSTERKSGGCKSDGGVDEAKAARSRNIAAARLTGFRNRGPKPPTALAFAKVTASAVIRTQPVKDPTTLKEVSQNSQERSKSQVSGGTTATAPAGVEEGFDLAVGQENEMHPSSNCKSNTTEKTQQDVDQGKATAFVTSFLARRQNSASLPPDNPRPTKVKRTLGRASSAGNGNSFLKATASPFVEDDTPLMNLEAPMPSQQITYEAPGAEEHRRLVSRRMGTLLEEGTGKRVESLGTVKDMDSFKAVGDRVRGRHREAR